MRDPETVEEWVWFYYDLGLKPIPIKKTETNQGWTWTPAINWKDYQTQRPSKTEIESWLQQGLFQGIALVCGKVSDDKYFYAVDCETLEQHKKIFEDLMEKHTIVVETGRGGRHTYFFTDKPMSIERYHNEAVQLDLQGDGSFVYAAPIISHKTGKEYKIISEVEEIAFVPNLAAKLRKRLDELGIEAKRRPIKEVAKGGIKEGSREESAFRYAWVLLDLKELDEKTAWYDLEKWNQTNQPPLNEDELQHAFQSALNYIEPRGITVQKTDIIIPIGNQEVRILKQRPNTVHPSIDYKNRVAYVGVALPTEIKTKKGVDYCDSFFLVTSNRELIYAQDSEQLISHNVILESAPMFTRPRWRSEHILNYVKGNEKVERVERVERVDPKHVYETILNQFMRFMEFPHEPYYDFCALWTIGTYFYHLFDAFPYLFINGVKQSGKTKLLNLIYSMSFNAMLSASITPAAIFRSIEALRCTLCIDEQEQLHNVHDEKVQALRSILLSGFMKGGSVQRVAGERNEQLMNFSTYSPKALANIFGIETILEDRCIVLVLLRAKGERKNVEPNLDDPIWYDIRDLLYRLFLDFAGELSELLEQDDGKIEGIEARELKIWRPIFALARFFEKHGVEGLVEQMKRLVEITHKHRLVSDQTESLDTMLASVLYERVKQDEWYSIREITNWLAETLGEMPKWLTPHYVGKALTRLGFLEKKHGKGGNIVRLTPSQVKDCAMRMRIENITIYQEEKGESKQNEDV